VSCGIAPPSRSSSSIFSPVPGPFFFSLREGFPLACPVTVGCVPSKFQSLDELRSSFILPLFLPFSAFFILRMSPLTWFFSSCACFFARLHPPDNPPPRSAWFPHVFPSSLSPVLNSPRFFSPYTTLFFSRPFPFLCGLAPFCFLCLSRFCISPSSLCSTP